MIALIRYFVRRLRVIFLVLAAGLFAFHFVMPFVFRSVRAQAGQTPTFFARFIPKGIQEFLGVDRLPLATADGFVSVIYQHPFVLIALLAFPIVACSTLLTGELERGWASLVLSRPVRRWVVVATVTICTLVGEALLVAAMLLGTHWGFAQAGVAGPAIHSLLRLGAGVFGLGIAVTGLSLFFAAACEEVGEATGWPITLLLLMYVGNYLAQLWPVLRPYAKYSLFYHYQPVRAFTEGAFPTLSFEVFGAVAILGMLGALVVYVRRDFRL
ncbi:putative permease [Candidatus Sumerlaea chitinivorans]|uniref:Putative permease n=1 Tax=Sumerlaea chitinivorans TaxID=2250252 RepID=A0A2Z4YB61_SUMC1|nr:putative permease [Candidatus Sumerlaea chitinivorans]